MERFLNLHVHDLLSEGVAEKSDRESRSTNAPRLPCGP